MSPDHRDLALTHLAQNELEAVDLAGGYRDALRVSLALLAERDAELRRVRADRDRLLDQYRVLRAVNATREAA